MKVPQLGKELLIKASVDLKVQNKQSYKSNNLLSLVNFMRFICNEKRVKVGWYQNKPIH